MVWVFPVPVGPYAKTVQLNPRRTSSTTGDTKLSKNVLLGRIGREDAVIIISSVGAAPAGAVRHDHPIPGRLDDLRDLAFLLGRRQGPDADGDR